MLLSTRVAAAAVATRVPLFVMCAAALTPPPAATDVWRPTFDDVDRISWGRPAKRKGTGSRGTPHRLNEEERLLYDMARSKGFVEIAGSGWRRQRSDAPLCNTYRSWCDACAQPAIVLHKSSDGIDTVVLDISPLRTPEAYETAAAFSLSLETATGGWIDAEGAAPDPTEAAGAAAGAASATASSRSFLHAYNVKRTRYNRAATRGMPHKSPGTPASPSWAMSAKSHMNRTHPARSATCDREGSFAGTGVVSAGNAQLKAKLQLNS